MTVYFLIKTRSLYVNFTAVGLLEELKATPLGAEIYQLRLVMEIAFTVHVYPERQKEGLTMHWYAGLMCYGLIVSMLYSLVRNLSLIHI